MSTEHYSLRGAKFELEDMKKGYPHKKMTDDNRKYWKQISVKAEIYKVDQTYKKIKI